MNPSFSINLSISIKVYDSLSAKLFPMVDLPTPIIPVKTRLLFNLIPDFEFDFS